MILLKNTTIDLNICRIAWHPLCHQSGIVPWHHYSGILNVHSGGLILLFCYSSSRREKAGTFLVVVLFCWSFFLWFFFIFSFSFFLLISVPQLDFWGFFLHHFNTHPYIRLLFSSMMLSQKCSTIKL